MGSYERSYDRGYDRGYGRGGYDRGYDRGPPPRRRPQETFSLHVRGYDAKRTTEEDLRSLFGKFGVVKDVYMPRFYETKEYRGFTYVQYEAWEDAEQARRELDRRVRHFCSSSL